MKTETVARIGPPCQLDSMGGEVEIELSSESMSCAEARGIYVAFREAVRTGEAPGIGESSEVEGWRCQEYPLAEYPLIVRCRQGARRFDVVGLAATAHPNQGPVQARDAPDPVIFQTPSGNIGCRVASTSVRCDIFDRAWSPPPRPEDCAYSWGHSIELDRNGSTFLCTNDALISPGGESTTTPVLKYGKAVGEGSFACESREQALICVAKSGHGFSLSFQKIKLF
jgi:hypothetical protein